MGTVADGYQPPISHFTPQHLTHWRQCTHCTWVLSGAQRPCQGGLHSFKGAVTLLPSELIGQGFYSTYFLTPKKDGGLRSILNLRRFNQYLQCLPFRRMLRLSTLLTFIKQVDCFTMVEMHISTFQFTKISESISFFFQGRASQ